MTEPITDLSTLLRSLDPYLHDGVYVYTSVPFDTDLSSAAAIATFRENEGLTVILAESDAIKAGFPVLFRAAWITLTVNSSFEAIGLTAAFSTALAGAGISCNVMAGAFHDHVFVPIERATEAMGILADLGNSYCL